MRLESMEWQYAVFLRQQHLCNTWLTYPEAAELRRQGFSVIRKGTP